LSAVAVLEEIIRAAVAVGCASADAFAGALRLRDEQTILKRGGLSYRQGKLLGMDVSVVIKADDVPHFRVDIIPQEMYILPDEIQRLLDSGFLVKPSSSGRGESLWIDSTNFIGGVSFDNDRKIVSFFYKLKNYGDMLPITGITELR